MSSDKPNKRDMSKAETRRKVLEAAGRLFGAGQYEAATMRSIAAEAGMSTGAIFLHWPDKASLYAEIYGHPPVTVAHGRAMLIALTCIRSSASNEASKAMAAETIAKWVETR